MRYVIIGSGIAGITAAKTICQYDSEGEITVYTNEFHPLGLYARKDLARSLRIGLKNPDELLIANQDALARDGIRLIYDEVLAVFPRIRQVLQPRHARRPYDRLLLAVGAAPKLVDAPGLHYIGVHQLRNGEDASMIEAWMPQLQQTGTVIIGGGILGLDVAYALSERGVPTTLVARESRVGVPVLSEAEAQFVQQRLELAGVEIILGQTLTAYLSEDDKVLDGVRLSGGRIITARMALCAVGVHPNTGFLEKSGIQIDEETGAILVNNYLQTNISEIYAAGNCAIVRGDIWRNWTAAAKQGRIAGLNMVGQQIEYQGIAAGDFRPIMLEEMLSTMQAD